MFFNKPAEQSNHLADHAALSAEQAIHATQAAANVALDSLTSAVRAAHDETAPLLNRANQKASAMAQRGREAVQHSAQQLRDQAQRAQDGTVRYIQAEPVKSLLIAAATGAALMAIISLVSHGRQRG
jgi:ElaB/YqjD/DUF883 family membrane-anchored ribosome-binding protein